MENTDGVFAVDVVAVIRLGQNTKSYLAYKAQQGKELDPIEMGLLQFWTEILNSGRQNSI